MKGDKGKKGIEVGRFDRMITIEYNDGSKDTTGEISENWVTLVTGWAMWIGTSSVGSERYENSEHVETVPGYYLIRYRTDVTAAMRIAEGSTTWAIKAVNDYSETENVPRQTWLKIKVEKKDNNNNSK